MKSQLKFGLLIMVVALVMTSLASCERINNQSEDNLTFVVDFATAKSELAVILELFDEVSSQTDGKGTPIKFDLSNFSKQTQLRLIDSTFFDGDAIEMILDFGSSQLPLKSTQKCLDGKFRAGQLRIIIQSQYKENTSQSQVAIEPQMGYCFGSADRVRKVHKLDLRIVRVLTETLDINIQHFEMHDKSVEIKGNLTMEKLTGINTLGVFGDHYQISGSGEVEGDDSDFKWKIAVPLLKKVEAGCGMIPVKGIVELVNDRSNKNATLDFDPFDNESCDRIVGMTLAGKEVQVVLE